MAIIEDLVVSEYGAFVGITGRRLKMSVPECADVHVPLMHLRSVRVLTRAATISAGAISACCEAGIPLHFIDPVEGNYASLLSPNLTTVVTSRRRQIAAIETQRGVAIAKRIIYGKIKSQIVNLRYLSRREEDREEDFRLAELDLTDCIARVDTLRGDSLSEIRAEMMGIEGYAGRIYWEALGWLIPDNYHWKGRVGRHANDPVNSLLNYGYGILYGEVQNALVIAGLEPYVGLIHTDRPGKPSLTLDFIEEFRVPIVDRTVIGLVRRGFAIERDDNGRMSRETRKQYAEHVLSRFNAQGLYQKKRYQLRSIIQLQARALAAAFREEQDYTPYTGG